MNVWGKPVSHTFNLLILISEPAKSVGFKLYGKVANNTWVNLLILISEHVQGASENRTSPVFKWSKCVRLPNGLEFEYHLKTGQNSQVFKWLTIHSYQNIIFGCLWYQPFENRSGIQMVLPFERYSDESGIQMVTVFSYLFNRKNIIAFSEFKSNKRCNPEVLMEPR